jgi:succinate dehydrogenase / fumarate reductase, membrane anchor subunit
MGLTSSGLKDWVIQRLTALIITVYMGILVYFFMRHSSLDYATWYAFFSKTEMKIATILVFFSLILHVWVGLWTIATDYIKCLCLRLTFEVAFIVGLLVCFLWTIRIVWGL